MKVRDAVKEDIAFIVEEGIHFLEYYPANLMDNLDMGYLYSLVDRLVTEHILLIAEEGERRVGMIAGYVTPHIYNPKIIGVQELFWWVLPEHRSSTAALKLFKAFEDAAEDAGMAYIHMTSTVYTPTLSKLYQRFGYKPVESSFYKEI